jgi:hypothetical protein
LHHIRLTVAALAAAAVTMAAVPAIASATRYVKTGATGGSDTSCATAAYPTVQSAVNAAYPGETVYICDTTPHQESVLVQKNLTLTGVSGATIEAPANSRVPTNYFAQHDEQDPNAVLTLLGRISVNVVGLTIEGPFDNTSCAYPTPPNQTDDDFDVLIILGANGQLYNDQVLNAGPSNPALEGCQFGVGVQVGRRYWPNTTGANGGYDVVNYAGQAQIDDTTVNTYAKNGITVDGPGSSAGVVSSTVNGGGQTAAVARNGIQISRGATGEVSRSKVEDNEYTGTGADAPGTGVLVVGGCGDPLSTGVQVQNNTLYDNDASADISDFDPTCSTAPNTRTDNQVNDNSITKDDGETNHSPFTDEAGRAYTGYQVGVADTGNGDTIDNNTITGSTPRFPYLDTAYGPQTVTGLPFLAPIDIQTYPPINAHVSGNTFDGFPTHPPYPPGV